MAGFKAKKAKLPNGARPSVDFDRTHADREWKDVKAHQLDIDDIVAGMGVVLFVGTTCRDEIVIEAGKPDSKDYFLDRDQVVKAFVKKEN